MLVVRCSALHCFFASACLPPSCPRSTPAHPPPLARCPSSLCPPPSLQLRRLPLFSRDDHVNTLAPDADGKLWAVLHKRGASDLVKARVCAGGDVPSAWRQACCSLKTRGASACPAHLPPLTPTLPHSHKQVNLETGAEEARVPRVGTQAHGLVFWDKRMLTLDSAGGVLVSVDPASNGTDAVQQLWQVGCVWACVPAVQAGCPSPLACTSSHLTPSLLATLPPTHCTQVGDADRFLKGLCVVDDIAFFGVCPVASEAARADPATSCDLAAYDLKQSVLLWRRQLPTKGLLNVGAFGGGSCVHAFLGCLLW